MENSVFIFLDAFLNQVNWYYCLSIAICNAVFLVSLCFVWHYHDKKLGRQKNNESYLGNEYYATLPFWVRKSMFVRFFWHEKRSGTDAVMNCFTVQSIPVIAEIFLLYYMASLVYSFNGKKTAKNYLY